MRLVVKKWIPQYGVALSVVKNKEVCCSVHSCLNTEKVVLLIKLNSFVLFLELYLLLRLSYTGAKILTRRTRIRRTICDFATFLFRTFPVSLMPIKGSASFVISTFWWR